MLWVDAVCINQAKDAVKEGNHQIGQMRLIYEKAKTVIAWLGLEAHGSDLVVNLVNQLKEHGISQEAAMNSMKDPADFLKWTALFDRCGREY